MSKNNLNIIVPKEYTGTPIEVVLREGNAAEPINPKEQEKINISGTVDAPFNCLEKRIYSISPKDSNIIVRPMQCP